MNVLGALGAGYTTEQVLKYLSMTFPHLAPRIKEAIESGKSTKDILKYLSAFDKNAFSQMKGKSSKSDLFSDLDMQNPLISGNQATKQYDPIPQGVKTATGIGLNVGGAALGGAALARGLPALAKSGIGSKIAQGIGLTPSSSGISKPTGQLQPQLNQQSPISASEQHLSTSQPPVDQVEPNIPQVAEIQQPEVKTLQAEQVLDNFGIKAQVDALLKNNPPDLTAKAVWKLMTPIQKKTYENAFKSGEIKPINEVVDEYAKIAQNEPQGREELESPGQELAQMQPPTEGSKIEHVPDLGSMGKAITGNLYSGMFEALQKGSTKFAGIEDPFLKKAKPLFDKGLIKSPEDLQKLANEKPKIEKGSTVSTPEGIAQIKETNGTNALVEENGKVKQVKVEDLEPVSFSNDEVADAYDNLFKKIPEEHRSGFIQWAGYDENRNVLGFIPRSGKYEELHNITPEEAEKIKEGKGTARTSGEKREGLWVAGEDTRGGIISQIIHDRRKAKESEEKKQLKFSLELPKKEKEDKGMKPIFDELSYARNLSRERDKKKADEERLRKKKEKDEAKKRKK